MLDLKSQVSGFYTHWGNIFCYWNILCSFLFSCSKAFDANIDIIANVFVRNSIDSIFSSRWTNKIIIFGWYLSTVKQTKFHVEVTNPAHRSISPFQIEHSRSPNIPSLLTCKVSFIKVWPSSSTIEQSKSAELWNKDNRQQLVLLTN